MMKKVELLAPAGNMDSLHAAVMAGCDAVYLGGYMFGARTFAGNFSEEELVEAIFYAHIHGVRVYVTVNTLIYESEVELFLEYIDFLYKHNVDAIIMQDLGMMDLVRKTYPKLEIHASTQMHIHNVESTKVIESLGLTRVVLARETSIQELQKIKENTSIELEVFVHGALCISYSGQCLMSKMIGGRSGNRGSCAGSCRLPYDIIQEKTSKKVNQHDYPLSMKDLNSLEQIEQLLTLGIDSLKIEGRMKRPEYVYLVTSIYRKAIDSFYEQGYVEIDQKDLLELQKIYQRSFTKGFLFQEDNHRLTNDHRPNHLGIPLGTVLEVSKPWIKIKLSNDLCIQDGIRIINDKEDLGCFVNDFYIKRKLVKEAHTGDIIELKIKGTPKVGDSVVKTTDIKQLKEIHELWKTPYRRIPLQGVLSCEVGKKPSLTVADGLHEVTVSLAQPLVCAKTETTMKEALINQLDRLQNTCYTWKKLTVHLTGNPFVSKGYLNQLRREMVEALNKKRCYQMDYCKKTYHRELPSIPLTHLETIYIETLEDYHHIAKEKVDVIYVNSKEVYDKINGDSRVILRLERACTSYASVNEVMVSEVGGLKKYKNFVTDTSLNVVNSYTLAFLYHMGASRVTLSYELEMDQMKEMLDAFYTRYHQRANVEVVTSGRPEILITKVDLFQKYHQKYTDVLFLRDRKRKNYPVKFFNDLTHIYHSDMISLNKTELKKIGVTNFSKHL